jgi:arginine deiminase
MELKLYSEFGTLKSVFMLRPGSEIERLTPDNTSILLFEDVPYLEAMQEEHDEYTALIKSVTDARVFQIRQLLLEILFEDRLRKKLLEQVMKDEPDPRIVDMILGRYSTAETVNVLIAGLTAGELKRKAGNFLRADIPDNQYLITPSPNFYFMRDPSAVIQAGVINSNMKYSGRQLESVILKMIFENHPEFSENYRQVFPSARRSGRVPTIEGGDIVVISDKVLAIGCSERTESAAIQEVARNVLGQGPVERVYEVRLPRQRNYMHLDTVFSIIDENLILTYSDAMEDIHETAVYRLEKGESGKGTVKKAIINESLTSILKKEIRYLEIVETGYGRPEIALKEQWYDGANVLAVGPRKVISYDRNKLTNRAMRDRGVDVIEIRSSELSRGLGGPRCMTLPIERARI